MKKYILIYIILIFPKLINAQSYVPFQFGNTRWMFNETKMFGSNSFCYFSSDTTGYYHNGKKFWKIEYVLNPTYSQSNIYRYIYDDTSARKIYTIDTITNISYLLYDFSASVGDTINSIYNLGFLDSVVIDSINNITINTILRKHIYVHSINNVNIVRTWIEGIGSTYELFYPSIYLPDPVYNLVCQEHNAFINFGNNIECSNFLTSYQNIHLVDDKISVSLNSTNNSIQIQNPNSISYSFVLFDLSGKQIQQIESTQIKEIINISDNSNCILLYNIKVKNKASQTGKIIKY